MQTWPSLREGKFSVSFFEVKSQTWTPIGHAPTGISWLTPVPKHGKVWPHILTMLDVNKISKVALMFQEKGVQFNEFSN